MTEDQLRSTALVLGAASALATVVVAVTAVVVQVTEEPPNGSGTLRGAAAPVADQSLRNRT